ncbi:hypothetical protein G4B88_029813 [Cannabis sativa]|nr:hypothetical protein G4B88_029813 [Cannabis sativa]
MYTTEDGKDRELLEKQHLSKNLFGTILKDAAKSIEIFLSSKENWKAKWDLMMGISKIQTLVDFVQRVDGGLKFDLTTESLVEAQALLKKEL